MIKAGNYLEGLDRCPHCGLAIPSLQFQSYIAYPYAQSTEYNHWLIYQCTACNNVVCALVLANGHALASSNALYLHNNKLNVIDVIPKQKTVARELPQRPRRYIEQAISSLHAPDGAIMLAGSAVDAMLKLKGYEDGSVHTRIGKAVTDGVLTAEMSTWAHAVRLEANKPRHADIDEPHATKELAEQAIEFVEALGEYLFVLPARIERGKIAATEAIKTNKDEPEEQIF